MLSLYPLLPLFDAGLFYDRTRSLGLGFGAALFVAAFAGAMPGASACGFGGTARSYGTAAVGASGRHAKMRA